VEAGTPDLLWLYKSQRKAWKKGGISGEDGPEKLTQKQRKQSKKKTPEQRNNTRREGTGRGNPAKSRGKNTGNRDTTGGTQQENRESERLETKNKKEDEQAKNRGRNHRTEGLRGTRIDLGKTGEELDPKTRRKKETRGEDENREGVNLQKGVSPNETKKQRNKLNAGKARKWLVDQQPHAFASSRPGKRLLLHYFKCIFTLCK
jgi:hypothetical protein